MVRGWLGVGVQPVTAATAKAFGLAGEPRGALVSDVTPGSPADRGGLLGGDIILEIDGATVKDSHDLSLVIGAKSPGVAVRLKAFREGREREFAIRLGEQPSKISERNEREDSRATGTGLGLSVQTVTADISRQLDLPPGTHGVIVTHVDSTSPAEDAGLARGDIIIEVNRKVIRTEEEFHAVIRDAGKKPILLLIERSGARLFIVVEPQ